MLVTVNGTRCRCQVRPAGSRRRPSEESPPPLPRGSGRGLAKHRDHVCRRAEGVGHDGSGLHAERGDRLRPDDREQHGARRAACEESSCAKRLTAGASSGRATRRVRGLGSHAPMMRAPNLHVHLTFLEVIDKLSFMLDVRRLRLLRELHARGTVTAVAEALAYTPSAVSQQLATLEREAGVPLVERHGRRLRLTDAGPRARRARRGGDRAARARRGRAGRGDGGRGRAAASASPRSRPRPRASCCRCSARCPREHPRLRLELVGDGGRGGAASCSRAARSTSWSPRSTTTRRARATRRCRSATSAATRSLARAPGRPPAVRGRRRRQVRLAALRRRALGGGARRHRVPRRARPRLPRARRLRARDSATAPTTSPCSSSSSPPARRSRCCRRSGARGGCPASRVRRGRRGRRWTGASSSPRAAAAPAAPALQGGLARAARPGARARAARRR